jgi:hypothetical protein
MTGQQPALQIPSARRYLGTEISGGPVRFACAALVLCFALAACGEPPAQDAAKLHRPAAKTGRDLPAGPVLSGVGVIASVEGPAVTLDHEAVAGGLPAGRNVFTGDAVIFAEAPLEPGARIAFSYQDWTPRPLLTELKAR